jgi:hypothetical protein
MEGTGTGAVTLLHTGDALVALRGGHAEGEEHLTLATPLRSLESTSPVSHHSRNQFVDRHVIQLGVGKQRLHALSLFG